jgi:hypothetical protein
MLQVLYAVKRFADLRFIPLVNLALGTVKDHLLFRCDPQSPPADYPVIRRRTYRYARLVDHYPNLGGVRRSCPSKGTLPLSAGDHKR